MKRVFVFAVVLLLIIAFSFTAVAHSGGTDSQGGHYNHATGEYHYHHGMPPHQHYGDVCSYHVTTIVIVVVVVAGIITAVKKHKKD